MTEAQKRLRDLRDRQSKERGRMAELAVLDGLKDEHRSELDAIEKGTADLERQLRAAAAETEEAEQRDAGAAARAPEGDAEMREQAELRNKVKVTSYVSAAIEQRSAEGPAANSRRRSRACRYPGRQSDWPVG